MLFMLRDGRTVLNAVVVCGLHEWGHLAAMAVLGKHIKAIRLSGFGICITTQKSPAEPLHESLAVLLAGPAVNILLYFLLKERTPDTALLSLGAGLYNLLPYSQLDGGAVIETLILGRIHERELRMALGMLRSALTETSALLVYIYGLAAVPVFAAILVLDIREMK